MVFLGIASKSLGDEPSGWVRLFLMLAVGATCAAAGLSLWTVLIREHFEPRAEPFVEVLQPEATDENRLLGLVQHLQKVEKLEHGVLDRVARAATLTQIAATCGGLAYLVALMITFL